MSKYKAGDRVKVRSDLQPSLPTGIQYGTYGANMDMIALRGEIVTIKSVHLDDSYSLQENGWLWTDEMFAGLAWEPACATEADTLESIVDILQDYKDSGRLTELDALHAINMRLSEHYIGYGVEPPDITRCIPDDSPDDADVPTFQEPDYLKVGDYVRVLAEWDDERYQDVGKIILALENDHCFVRFEDKEEKSYQNYDLKKLTTGEPHPEIKSSLEERAEIEKKQRIGTIEMVFPEEKKQEIIEEIKDAYMKFIYDRPAVEPDPVNHPSHYADRPVEVIDTIEEVIARYPASVAYHIGCTLEYIFRGPFKGKLVEDLKKSAYYLNRAIELLEETK